MGAGRPDATAGIKADVPAGTIVFATAIGSNVTDVDGNRYVDLAAGFGALLLGHCHPSIVRVLGLQAERLLMALGDVHPADAKVALVERLSKLYPEPGARVIVTQSGSDAITAALKTARLYTGKPGIVAFEGAYHGLGYAPLAACGLRAGYREPFSDQLNPHVTFVPYPHRQPIADVIATVAEILAHRHVGALLVEPILGRGGCIVPTPDFVPELARLAREAGALLIADEIWTGLGRAGKKLFSVSDAVVPDLICLGKGLGGGLPVAACIGRREVMQAWRQEREVVHTSTFAGAPLACTTALCLLDLLEQQSLAERSATLGARWLSALESGLAPNPIVSEVRGAGLMIGIDLGERPSAAVAAQRALLERGYIVSTGGGGREVLVLTPPLTIAEPLLDSFVAQCAAALGSLQSL
jgi:4-aminobutyrate aminotransferase/(S)-3-amino-2-methylpropionate transaminase